MMTDEEETVGIFIEPYCETEEGWIHNGLIAALPGSVGVSMGYINFPSTFVDKGNAKPSTSEYVKKAKVRGSIYSVKGNGRQGMHEIVRKVYGRLHERAVYHKSPEEAAESHSENLCGTELERRVAGLHGYVLLSAGKNGA